MTPRKFLKLTQASGIRNNEESFQQLVNNNIVDDEDEEELNHVKVLNVVEICENRAFKLHHLPAEFFASLLKKLKVSCRKIR